MHKLAKGLKKKHKKKKGKKGEDDEEFDPEELERYRRERAEALQKQAEEAESGGEQSSEQDASTKPAAGANDEWKKFQALTSGIDTILKKTQDDLDRIKSQSFYQRKAPEPEPDPEEAPEVIAKKQELAKRYAGFDKDGNPIEIKSDEEEDENVKALHVTEDGIVEVPDDDDEHEDSAEEDIFDTAYIEALANIDVQLAYIPDSPTEEQGDDPFDTTDAEKVLKIVDTKTGKKLVSLGNAVEVLAGRVDYQSKCRISKTGRPRVQTDLLLDDDFDVPIPVDNSEEAEHKPIDVLRTLLDDDSDLPDIPIDLTKLPPVLPRPVTPATDGLLSQENGLLGDNKALDISEFELFKDKTLLDDIPVLDDEEFDLDAPAEPLVVEETDDPFAEKGAESLDIQNEIIEVSFEAATFVNEDDPFDTTIAENIVPGKTELRFIERELEDIDFDPRAGERRESQIFKQAQNSLIVAKKDLLGGSATDLSQLGDTPIKPIEELTYVDPFDTSNIQDIPPGRTELKVLEQELLKDTKRSVAELDDEDFNPRAEETPKPAPTPEKKAPPRPPAFNKPVPEVTFAVNEADFEAQAQSLNITRKPSRPEALNISPKIVAFEVPTPSKKPDLLASSEEEKTLPGKPLTPYYPQKSLEEVLPSADEIEEAEVDPFDTSFVANTAPGKTELKIIESELLQEQQAGGISRSISDHNFDPRSQPGAPAQNRRQSDFGAVSGQPIVKSSEVIEELINKRKALEKRQDSILDTDVEVAAVPLAPNVKPSTIEEEIEQAYKDPFDTSYAENIAPGKAELKLLENELSQVPDLAPIKTHPVIELAIKQSLSIDEDPDFDPRGAEKDILCADIHESTGDKILTPVQD